MQSSFFNCTVCSVKLRLRNLQSQSPTLRLSNGITICSLSDTTITGRRAEHDRNNSVSLLMLIIDISMVSDSGICSFLPSIERMCESSSRTICIGETVDEFMISLRIVPHIMAKNAPGTPCPVQSAQHTYTSVPTLANQ